MSGLREPSLAPNVCSEETVLMFDLRITDISADQAIAISDGLAGAGFFEPARSICANAAARELDPVSRYRLRLRVGLLGSPTVRTNDQLRLLKELEGVSNRVFLSEGLATWYKTIPFLEDERFMALADEFADLLPIPNWHWNLQTVVWAVQHTAAVEGDLVELGVFRGHTTRFVADYVGFQNSSKRWRLYDTFEGIPTDQIDPGWEQANEVAYTGKFSYEEVVERFRDFPNIEVIRGRVPEILSDNCPEKISFLHMDLNNSTAEIAALDLLFDRLTLGALVVFDDFGWATARAQFDAERRWFDKRGLHVLPLPTGQGLFIKK
jgi:hypothetical protein